METKETKKQMQLSIAHYWLEPLFLFSRFSSSIQVTYVSSAQKKAQREAAEAAARERAERYCIVRGVLLLWNIQVAIETHRERLEREERERREREAMEAAALAERARLEVFDNSF